MRPRARVVLHGRRISMIGERAARSRSRSDVAVITVQPGSKSQQNAQRRGFDLLYTRAILVKQP